MKAETSTETQSLLLDIADVARLSSLSKSSIYRGVAAGTFPAPVRVAPGRVAWRQSDLTAWVATLSDFGDNSF